MPFTVCLTHDVDRVYKSYQYLTHDLRFMRVSKLRHFFKNRNPYWQFEKIMEIENILRVRSTFFFLQESMSFPLFAPVHWSKALGKYSFTDYPVSKIIKTLDSNGWEIALHGSYFSYKSLELLRKEKAALENVLKKPVYGIRQHYLNLEIPQTWLRQKTAGFLYDASYGLIRNIGFREHTYHPFWAHESDLLIIPLTLMDGYLFKIARDLSHAWDLCQNLIEEASKHKALLTVLWHQRVFNEAEFPGYSTLYKKFLCECQRCGAKFARCCDVLDQESEKLTSRRRTDF